MRYQPLPASLYRDNRARFMQQMQGNALAVFNSNDIYPISADSTLPLLSTVISLPQRRRPRRKHTTLPRCL